MLKLRLVHGEAWEARPSKRISPLVLRPTNRCGITSGASPGRLLRGAHIRHWLSIGFAGSSPSLRLRTFDNAVLVSTADTPPGPLQRPLSVLRPALIRTAGSSHQFTNSSSCTAPRASPALKQGTRSKMAPSHLPPSLLEQIAALHLEMDTNEEDGGSTARKWVKDFTSVTC